MNKRYIWLLIIGIIIPCLIMGIGFWYYWKHFSGPLTSDSGNWGDFGDFHSYFVNVVTMIFVVLIGFITYRTTNEFNHIQLRPLVILTVEPPSDIKGYFPDSWYVVNGANSPATNVIVRFSFDSTGDNFSKWVSCYPLSQNSKKELAWLHWANRIEVCYSDITERKFFRYMYQDLSGRTRQIKEKEYLACLEVARNNRANNTINLRDKLSTHLKKGGQLSDAAYKNFITPLIF